ncbi:polysaccharide lyase family 1 protein [Lentithecium fluviatile CBS 122367]|uniref:pectate lyase n=1 Tax=Lentithecium fluviatile CBS 122367 TaxID=1168545 RepID=A0A6G1JDW5_9PLEO|nr:polysaccharide lyase family 1 protein [Lentithecium fluviatile CBS 122367]
MKLSSFLSLGLAAFALAAPTPTEEKRGTLAKRAAITETPTTGYATQNGGTTGGKGGTTTTVSSLAQFTAAVSGDTAKVVVLSKSLTNTEGSTAVIVKVGSNKTIVGNDSSVTLTNIGLSIKSVRNVIVRNLAIKKVIASGDNIAVQKATNVWLDHLDLSSDQTHGKDYYDGLLDLTHAADYITISYVKLHDHYKASLIGHSDDNKSEDSGHLRVTYYNCHWLNINSRGPSVRFGTVHLFNNYYDNVADGINVRLGAQALVQNNVWVGGKKPLYAVDNDGYAVASGNDFGDGENTAPTGTLKSVPYTVPTLMAVSAVKAAVVGKAGNTLSF